MPNKYQARALSVFTCDNCGKEFKSLTKETASCPDCDRILCPQCADWKYSFKNVTCSRCLGDYLKGGK